MTWMVVPRRATVEMLMPPRCAGHTRTRPILHDRRSTLRPHGGPGPEAFAAPGPQEACPWATRRSWGHHGDSRGGKDGQSHLTGDSKIDRHRLNDAILRVRLRLVLHLNLDGASDPLLVGQGVHGEIRACFVFLAVDLHGPSGVSHVVLLTIDVGRGVSRPVWPVIDR